MALLLHLLLVGLVPMGEALHDHDHASGSEWHTDGSHQHGDEPATECPLLLATTSTCIVAPEPVAPEFPPAYRFVSEPVVDLPRPAAPFTSVTARGPPAR